MRFRGIYAPLATPFDHRGRIYWSKFDYNLAQLGRTKLSGFVVGDKWGEGPLLSDKERIAVWERAVQRAGDEFDIIASVTGGGVSTAKELASAAAGAGCGAVLLGAPDTRELAPSEETDLLFFRAVADSIGLPLLVSVRLGNAGGMRTETLSQLASHPGIAGVSVDRSPAASVSEAAKACGPRFAVVARDLECAAPCLADGASAAVLAIAAAVPFYALSIEEAVRTRDHAAASSLTARALEFEGLLASHGVPALKHALDLRSFYGGVPRLPLLRASGKLAEAVSDSLRDLAS